MNDDQQPEINNSSSEIECLDLQSIYTQLSTSDNTNFDGLRDERFVMECIAECFNKDFLMIDTLDLLRDVNKLNVKFVELIKFCKTKNFIKIHIIFCVYCEYFNLPVVECYANFHEKLQNLIKLGYRKMVGESVWSSMNKKFSAKPTGQPSLFDLFGKK